jgi:hypothetical protein
LQEGEEPISLENLALKCRNLFLESGDCTQLKIHKVGLWYTDDRGDGYGLDEEELIVLTSLYNADKITPDQKIESSQIEGLPGMLAHGYSVQNREEIEKEIGGRTREVFKQGIDKLEVY